MAAFTSFESQLEANKRMWDCTTEAMINLMEQLREYNEQEWVKVHNRWDELRKKQLALAKRYGSVEVDMEELLLLNVGGQTMDIRRSIMTQMEGTRLAALFSGRWDKRLCRDKDGR